MFEAKVSGQGYMYVVACGSIFCPTSHGWLRFTIGVFDSSK